MITHAQMRRRLLMRMGIVASALPRVAGAQPSVARIGFLGLGSASSWADQIEALRAGMRDLGHVEGKNTTFEFQWAERSDQLSELALRLVRMKVDVIIAPASTEVEPARQATTTIPIVFAQHADPVGIGHVVSLARPGGNITGMSMLLPEIAAKALEILKDTVPGATRIGVLWNPTTPSHIQVTKAVEAIAAHLGVELLSTPIQAVGDFEAVFLTMARERADGFLTPSSPLTNSERVPLANLALRYRLPGIFVNKENVEAGGLMSYGADFNYMYRRVALYVDKILKGEKASDLPVEQASKYELVINMKTAKAIGLTIPPSMLARADEVIE
jgi:putative ABC transport system substrate-binding protein